MIGIKLGKHLNTNQPAIANRLSNRIYPDVKPQKINGAKPALPNAIISIIGGNPDYTLTGPIGDLAKTVQVDVDAETRYEANEIADLIRTAIEFSSTNPLDQTWDDTTVLSCTVENERDQTFSPTDASDQWVFRRSIDYRVTYVR